MSVSCSSLQSRTAKVKRYVFRLHGFELSTLNPKPGYAGTDCSGMWGLGFRDLAAGSQVSALSSYTPSTFN